LEVTKSELIERLVMEHPHLSEREVELTVKSMVEHMREALARGERIEIRGFGSFPFTFSSSPDRAQSEDR
jgi:integration host factor subunit beta